MSEFFLRTDSDCLKPRAVQCAKRRNIRLTPWLEEAITEKVEREEQSFFAQKGDSRGSTPIPSPIDTQPIQTHPEAQECKAEASCCHQGFPPANEAEVEKFWGWMDLKQAKGTLLSDEVHYLNHPHDKIPPKFLLERLRRETEH